MTETKLLVRLWYHGTLPNSPENANLTVTQRKSNATRQLREILKSSKHGEDWQMLKPEFTHTTKQGIQHFKIKVYIKWKKHHPPDNPSVPPKPRIPPPSM